jgi:hypothetical protein
MLRSYTETADCNLKVDERINYGRTGTAKEGEMHCTAPVNHKAYKVPSTRCLKFNS